MKLDLNGFKQASERLRAQLSGRAGDPATFLYLSQVQALDLLAKAHGFSDFDEASRHLERASQAASPEHKPHVMAIVGSSGCGKTTLSKQAIARALSAGVPVRILGYREYPEFEGVPGARIFAGAGGEDFYGTWGDDFYAAWGSDAPLVIGVCTSSDARALDFSRMGLSSDALFVCDEATDFASNLRPLGGTTILVARFLQGFPISPSVYFSHSASMGGWQTIVPREHLGRCVADLALHGLRGTATP